MLPTQSFLCVHTGKYQGFLKRYQNFIFVHKFKSYRTPKLAVIEKNHKSPTTYILNAILCSESLLSEGPGFESQRAQTLGTHSSAAP